LAVGLLKPTSGVIEVAGGHPASGPAQMAKVGFVAQDTPTYAGLTVADHLRLGAHLKPPLGPRRRPASASTRSGSIRPRRRAGLSGGHGPNSR